MRGTLAFLLALGAAQLSSGCGPARCNGQDADSTAGAPRVSRFYVLDQQVPGDPWTVVFGVDFEDSEGDLGGGLAELYMNSATEPSPTQALAEVMAQSGLPQNATSGSFWMRLRFDESTIEDGTSVWLGLQLLDSAGRRSNCYSVELEFDVQAVADARPALSRWAVSRRCLRNLGGAS